MSHSIIPPSSAHIWGSPNGCPGWVTMSQCYPEIEVNEKAAKGTASHEIGAILITEYSRGNYSATAKDFIGKTGTNGVIFTDVMFEAAELYAKDVADAMRETSVFGGKNFGTEQRVEAKKIHELSFGTTDQFLFDEKNGHLFLWDYKFGYEIVEAFENWQSINYVAGIFELLNINGLIDDHITVHIRIVQPRAFHRDGSIREWVVKGSTLRGYFNTLHYNAAIALGNDATCHSGPHCKHCSARHACEAALKGGLQLYEASSKPTPVEMSPEALGVQYSIVKRAREHLEDLESGFQEQVKFLIRSGKMIPNWMVEPSIGRERWAKSVKEIVAMGDMMGHNLRKPEDVCTPNQARKKGIDDTVIKIYSEKPNTGLKLVPDNGNKAKRIFSQ